MNQTKKHMREFWDRHYTIILKRDDEGFVIARVKELDGCVARGKDADEAVANLDKVKRAWIDSCYKAGDSLPYPENEPYLPSGRWLQRVPRSLHKQLIKKADSEGVSLNQLVTSYIAKSLGAADSCTTRKRQP